MLQQTSVWSSSKRPLSRVAGDRRSPRSIPGADARSAGGGVVEDSEGGRRSGGFRTAIQIQMIPDSRDSKDYLLSLQEENPTLSIEEDGLPRGQFPLVRPRLGCQLLHLVVT